MRVEFETSGEREGDDILGHKALPMLIPQL